MRAAGAILLCSIGLAMPGQAAAAPPTGPSDCGAKPVRATLVSFAASLNRGNLTKLDEIFAKKPEFQWYSTDGRIGQAAKRRDTLIAYLARRWARGERLGLARFRFTGNSPRYGNFEMTMRRSIPGVRGGRWLPVPGKGAAVCEGGSVRLIVMSFGRVPGG